MSEHGGVPHHAESKEQKRIGIVIAIIAVFMAVVGALVNNAANDMIVKEVQSSNGFAWYQAKRQRSYLNEVEIRRIEIELNGNPTDAQRKLLEESHVKLKAKNAEYEKENDDIRKSAVADKREAELSEYRHHHYEYGEILLHIAIVLCSLTLLTESKLFFKLGLVATAAGIVLAMWTLVHKPPEESHSERSTPAAAAGASPADEPAGSGHH